MSIILVFLTSLFLLALVGYALSLAGYWTVPQEILAQFREMTGKSSEPPEAFRAWVEQELSDYPELREWLLSLSDEAFAMLTDRVVKFCADLNIRLSWLVQGEIAAAPALRKSLKTIVVDYVEVCWEAVRHQADIGLFDAYHKLISSPADSRYRDSRRKLFTRLAEAGLVQPLPTYELIMASELQRQTLAARAIREAASKDWESFSRVYAELLAADAQPAEATAAAA